MDILLVDTHMKLVFTIFFLISVTLYPNAKGEFIVVVYNCVFFIPATFPLQKSHFYPKSQPIYRLRTQ